MEQVEQVSDRRHVARHVRIVRLRQRIGEIVAATRAERSAELPVPLDEFHEGGMLVVDVAYMAACGEG